MAAKPLVLVTRVDDGSQFKVSANKIIEFKAQSNKTLLSYVDQRGKFDHLLVEESVSTINTDATRTQAVTLYPSGIVVYINSDRIIKVNSQTWGSRITYDISGDRGKYNQPPKFYDVLEAGADISTAAGNLGLVYPQAGKAYWINGDFADIVVKDPSNPADYVMLYDSRKTEFEKLPLSSSNTYLSISSDWS